MQLSRATVLDYDAVLQHIGAFGRWQRRIFLLMSLVSAASGVMALSWVFTGYQPRVRCQIPYCEGAPAAYYGPGDARRVPDFARSSVQQLKGCAYYRPAGAPENLSCAAYIDVLNGTNASLVPHQCDSFVFDTSVMRSSAVSEYDLVCHRANLQELCGSLYMVCTAKGGGADCKSGMAGGGAGASNPPLREQRPCQSDGRCYFHNFWRLGGRQGGSATSCFCAEPCTHSVQDLHRLLSFHNFWNCGIWWYHFLARGVLWELDFLYFFFVKDRP